jgi:hypothetical protein
MNEISTSIISILIKFLGWLLIFLSPIHSIMIGVGVMIFFDLITGLWASKKTGRPITSFGFRRTIVKSLAYQLALISSLIMETIFLQGMPVIRIIAGMIAITEFKSFLENIYDITGLDLWLVFLEKLQGSKIPQQTLPPKSTPVELSKPLPVVSTSLAPSISQVKRKPRKNKLKK